MTIVDTNVLSEFMKDVPNEAVYFWMNGIPQEELFTTAISVAEVLQGIEWLPEGRRRRSLSESATRVFGGVFAGRILPFNVEAAEEFAGIIVARRRSGSSYKTEDCMIAAIAKSVGMAVATRNVRDFEGVGVEVIDPWAAGGGAKA
ncbi:MAG: type II toxin-antitoxin system VapC family toxin [Chloroflexota bacterium]|nr:type II toxin-antitoxin system VapC family toxin [Chloroflexota bacterium]